MKEPMTFKTAGNYQDMAWRTLCCQEEIWVQLRENIVLPHSQIREEIALEAEISDLSCDEARGLCGGVLDLRIYWQRSDIRHSLLGGEEGEESWLRQSFLWEPLDGGRKALACPSLPFGISRFAGFLWQGQKIRREVKEGNRSQEKEACPHDSPEKDGQSLGGPKNSPAGGAYATGRGDLLPLVFPEKGGGSWTAGTEEAWQKKDLQLSWQAPWVAGALPREAELVCLHGVRTGLRTVLLEALVRIPMVLEGTEGEENFWLGREDILLELEEDAVKEVLGVGFIDGMEAFGYDRDTGSLQLEWMSQLIIFYLREPSGGGRIGMLSVPYRKTASLAGLEAFGEMPRLTPLRRDVEVQVLRSDRLLCRFGLYIRKEKQMGN